MRLTPILFLFLLSFSAQATTYFYQATTYFYQASGVEQYQQSGRQMVAVPFDVGNFQTLAACNAAVAAHSNLMDATIKTPASGNDAKVRVDALCHAVLPLQLPGWHVIGIRQVQRGSASASDPSQALPVSIGPFADEPTCKAAIAAQKSLTLQNTPLSDQNVFTSLTAKCHKLF